MSEYVTLLIDGARVRAPRGVSVLDAALDYGICIPHLC
ncbi:2Fe-2S iron-sulfur cluster-binding protein, partial [Candidatus Omnitrophota bacterium]